MKMIDEHVLALPGARKTLALLAACGVADALLAAGQAWSVATAVVSLWRTLALSDVLVWVAAFAGCYAVRQVLAYARSRFSDGYAAQSAAELRLDLVRHVFAEGQPLVQVRGTGSLVTAAMEEVALVETYLGLILPKIADLFTVPMVLIVVLFALDWISGVIALVVFPCVVFYMQMLGSHAKAAAQNQHGEFRRLSNSFVDTLRGIGTLKLFGRSREQGRKVFEQSEALREATVKTLRSATMSSLILGFFEVFVLAAIAIMLGFRLLTGDMDFTCALCCLIVAPEYFGAVRRYSTDFHASLDGQNALADICGILQTGTRNEGGLTSLAKWGPTSHLEVQNASFSYPDCDADALSNVSLRADGLMNIGIVGASGSGKSTLACLMAGFTDPREGSVDLDGVRLGGLNHPDWRSQVTYIPQNPHIFAATLRDNLAFYRTDASEAEVMEAVRDAGLAELVENLPQGIDTMVGEGGRRLSGGEAQRVALARAFLDKDRKILVFDEPTAHLDIETELALKDAMLRLMEGRLVFFSTHRLHWMQNMDHIVVLEHGRVAQAGTLGELLSCDGAFSKLVEQLDGGESRG